MSLRNDNGLVCDEMKSGTPTRGDQLEFEFTNGDFMSDDAIEKQIKRWRREKKLALIRNVNPKFRDLTADFPR